MNKLYMLIGIPGSGKTTWAEENLGKLFDKYYSSDAYRMVLFDDENYLGDGRFLFYVLERDLISELHHSDVCYDATNLHKRYRKRFLKKIPKDTWTIAVVFNIPIDVCKERNRNRDRVVPENVIDRMYKSFSKDDTYDEFDEVIYVGGNNDK